jgi:hypothetical protein
VQVAERGQADAEPSRDSIKTTVQLLNIVFGRDRDDGTGVGVLSDPWRAADNGGGELQHESGLADRAVAREDSDCTVGDHVRNNPAAFRDRLISEARCFHDL